ncbi:Decapping scavenger enzyme [Aphelenchoides fujianensis]|nr:Decapping scavenger enzyme [Aphelenchoides fujianensis]
MRPSGRAESKGAGGDYFKHPPACKCAVCRTFRDFDKHLVFGRYLGTNKRKKEAVLSVRNGQTRKWGLFYVRPQHVLSPPPVDPSVKKRPDAECVADLLRDLKVQRGGERNAEFHHLNVKFSNESKYLRLRLEYPVDSAAIVRAEDKARDLAAVRREMWTWTETSDFYARFHEPQISGFDDSEWLRLVFEEQKEELEFVDCGDPTRNFFLIRDPKMDKKRNKEDVHYLALPERKDLRSLRQAPDLHADHLPLLEAIRTKGAEVVGRKHNLPPSKLNAHFHYPPSKYRLHVHFAALPDFCTEDAGTHGISKVDSWLDGKRGHPLAEVIGNIRLMPDFYQRVSLQCTVFSHLPLFDVIKRARRVDETADGELSGHFKGLDLNANE